MPYFVTDTYEEVLRLRQRGRLPAVQLIFPNVELRLDVMARSGYVNIHFLLSPEDPNHLAELQRILGLLHFSAHSDRYRCTRDELIRLGRRSDPAIVDDRGALSHGATQFRVSFDELRRVFSDSEWANKNILIAVAGGTDDGTAGLRQASDTTLRQEIHKFAHVIFSSSAAQREFWLGQRAMPFDQLRETFNGCKPCLHGSDAHQQTTVGQPAQDRFSWIKGALTFDALRQACIDPDGRAYVGSTPPMHAIPSQMVAEVQV